MFEEPLRPSGRRSKLEITCDILTVVSRGAEKPTRIMQLANVTWDDLIMYLEALIRNELLSRKVERRRVTYSVTPRGAALLGHYLELKKAAAPLQLDSITKERISKALTYAPAIGSKESEIYAALEARLRREGGKVVDSKVQGKSGVVHTFGLVTENSDGSRHGYFVTRDIDETQVMKLFVIQLDTEIGVHLFYSGGLAPKVAALARAYSLELFPWDAPSAKESRVKS